MFEITPDPDGTVYFVGRLDASQTKEALRVLDRIDHSITADLGRLEYISSAGIGAVLGTYKRLTDAGHRLRIVNVTPRIAMIFRYAGLDTLLGIEEAPGAG